MGIFTCGEKRSEPTEISTELGKNNLAARGRGANAKLHGFFFWGEAAEEFVPHDQHAAEIPVKVLLIHTMMNTVV